MGEGGGVVAELTAFGYHPGDSILHRLDPRFKLGGLIAATLVVLNSGMAALGLWSAACAILLVETGVSRARLVRELRYFGILIFFVFVARALSAGGEPLVQFRGIGPSRQGMMEGVLVGWRLGLVVLLGLLLMATTRSWQVKAAVESLLRPVPFIPRKRAATMIGLLLRFIPQILSAARETADAQRARSIENRRNPVFRLVKLAVPLLRKTFLDADRLAAAMDARCYTEDRSTPPLSAAAGDWLFLAAVCALAAAALFLPRL